MKNILSVLFVLVFITHIFLLRTCFLDGFKAGKLNERGYLLNVLLNAPLPPVATNLTINSPLIFHHQRKAGGTSLRTVLIRTALEAGLPVWEPCYNGSCDSYTWGSAHAAVYAGHFPWGVRRELSRFGWYDSGTHSWRTPEQLASCVTLFREPVARLESAYYYRFVQVKWIEVPTLSRGNRSHTTFHRSTACLIPNMRA